MGDHSVKSTSLVGNTTYDVLRNITQMGLPALGTFYFTIAPFWHLPFANEVVGSLAALTVLLGVFLAISRKTYKNDETRFEGTLNIDPSAADPNLMAVELNKPVTDSIQGKKEVTFKVEDYSQK